MKPFSANRPEHWDHLAVAPDQLRWTCDPARLPFETTDEVEPLADVVGQDRALRALTLGMEMRGRGYNLFVAGAPGTGRTVTTLAEARRIAAVRPAPADWCYVHKRSKASSRPAAGAD